MYLCSGYPSGYHSVAFCRYPALEPLGRSVGSGERGSGTSFYWSAVLKSRIRFDSSMNIVEQSEFADFFRPKKASL